MGNRLKRAGYEDRMGGENWQRAEKMDLERLGDESTRANIKEGIGDC